MRKRRSSGHPTVADVAQKAGVSAISVSRALRNPKLVSEQLRFKISAAIEAIGYVPDPNARALASAQSNIIGVIIPSLSNNVFDDVIKGIYNRLGTSNYNIQIGNCRYERSEEERLVKTFIAQRPAALIVTGVDQNPNTHKLLKHCNIPIVQIMEFGGDPVDMSVGFDQTKAASSVAEYLVNKGYKKIASISARMDARVTRRAAAFKQKLREFSLLNENLQISTKEASSVSLGKELTFELLNNVEQIDAIFCHNDNLALGCLAACQSYGIKIPDDIAIIGFNDLEYMQAMYPALSSIKTHRYDIGFKAMSLAIDTINGIVPAEKNIDTGFEIIERASTKSQN